MSLARDSHLHFNNLQLIIAVVAPESYLCIQELLALIEIQF